MLDVKEGEREREREGVERWEGMKNFACKFGDLFLSLDVRCKGERVREGIYRHICSLFFICALVEWG